MSLPKCLPLLQPLMSPQAEIMFCLRATWPAEDIADMMEMEDSVVQARSRSESPDQNRRRSCRRLLLGRMLENTRTKQSWCSQRRRPPPPASLRAFAPVLGRFRKVDAAAQPGLSTGQVLESSVAKTAEEIR